MGSIPIRAASIRTWRSLASRQVGDLEIAGSNPAVLTGKRAKVQMGERLLREQEGLGSTPGRPTRMVVEGWSPKRP